MKFAEIDRCAVPQVIANEVTEVKRRTGATLNSCDRSDAAEAILNRNGKSTQEQLYLGFIRGLPGYNPANKPGQSTHERRNDGVAFRGPVGMLLPAWKVGQDWQPSEVPDILRAYAQLGWRATLTYPGNPRETQHVNVVSKGRDFVPFRVIRRGSRGAKVAYVRWALGFVHDPDTHKPYLPKSQRLKALTRKQDRTFGEQLEAAVKRFQRDWGQRPDGVYGRQTDAQLKSRVRARKRKNREKKR